MKSMLTYDMHNYAEATDDAPNIIVEMETTPTAGSEKYSLRQRHKRKLSSDIKNNNTNNNDEIHSTSSEMLSKHQLVNCRKRQTKRNILAPVTQETAKKNIANSIIRTAKMPKAKTKAAPLSKYRRKTANARERTRMREINTAFEKLRYCVPPTISGDDANQTNDKLTKITTLRCAMKYIELLSKALTNPNVEATLLQELSLNGDNRFTTQAIPIEIPLYQELPLTPEPKESRKIDKKLNKNAQKLKSHKTKTANSTNSARKVVQNKITMKKTQNTQKKNTKKNQTLTQTNLPLVLSSASTSSAYSSQYSNISFSSSASSTSDMSNTSYTYDGCLPAPYVNINPMEITNLLLESDGESLHLSEHCLSPLEGNNNNNQNNTKNLFTTTANSNCFTSFDNMALSTLENPLELSLRLLDPEISDQQQPSACMSPLSGLGSLTPFCDLLSADFPEHNSLDMFLT